MISKITISGLAGTGTSSAGKTLAEKINYKFFSNGDFSRMQAKELGLTIYEIDEISKTDSKFDLMRDKMVEEMGKNEVNFIAEGRLTWYFIPDAFKVKFDCDFDTRVNRVATRDHIGFEEAKKLTLQRKEAIKKRFSDYYGIEDAFVDSHFDLIIDTTNSTITKNVDQILNAINSKRS